MIFPSVEWFEALAAEMEADRAVHQRIGEIDTTCVFSVLDAPGGDFHVKLRFEELSLVEITPLAVLDPEHPGEDVDFVLEGDWLDWREMIEHIRPTGRADREHTLNYLSLPGVPLRCWSPDPLGRDMFFRFNQSLQVAVNACARFDTTYPVEA